MRITQIKNGQYNRNLSFQRKLREDEKASYQKDMETAFNVAGVKERVAITHGSVFPALGRNTFIGSPYGEAAKKYIEFLKLNGFNGNQLGPNGGLSENNISPYNTSALNENRLFLDLEALTTPKYGSILSQEIFNAITIPIKNNEKNYTFTNFEEAEITYGTAVRESFKTFRKNLVKNQPEAIKLNNEFQEFLQRKGKQTEEEGIFKVLATLNGTEDIDKWKEQDDANLMKLIRKGNSAAIKKYNSIAKLYGSYVKEYQFEQFLLNKQIKENKEFRDNIGFKYYSDFLVGCSSMDRWRYKEAFLDGYSIGAREGGNTPHQTWGVPVLNPRMLFKSDTEYNIGAMFLQEKIDHALEYCENTRIDHVQGLVEPFIYEEASVKYKVVNNEKIQDKEVFSGDFMSEMKDKEGNMLDDYASYRRILSNIILKRLEKHGLQSHDPVWEDICCNPPVFDKIYRKDLQLPKLVSMDWAKPEEDNSKYWYLIGSHDSIPAMNMLKDNDARRYNSGWDAMHLAGYLHQDPVRSQEREDFCKKIAGNVNGRDKVGEELKKADRDLVTAKFAELFTKEKIQVSFADILGINDKNIVYNIGGSDNQINWKERISADFIDKYYENLSSDNPTALNMPEILKIAVRAKMDMEIVRSSNPDETRARLYEENKQLLENLDHWTNVLKEKE